ncbi:MAG: nitroreductase family protein [Anaerolineales bacterium]|uniref:Nitroreductase family protein n=1 Tax=Candidatus Desulfolinea nitratireducens TaxID=2841698 RepID=A0A8J6TIF3_9CHLR|nr:nitroreductase family protein [Candidatus Desulfolinea nitratireducens]MBL6961582.1 nitroreductase family protein [Anaerolineales bacterium]
MNDFHHFLRTRRSVRRFKPDPVPASVVDRILATAVHAPSAHNLQPWRFATVQKKINRKKLGEALTKKMQTDMRADGTDQAEIDKRVMISLRRIDEAPLIILLCRDMDAIRKEEPEEVEMGVQSVAMAGLQILLAAHAESLGGNWICWPLYAQNEARDSLKLPETWQPQAMIFLGYADETPTKALRQPAQKLLIVK